MILDTVLTHTGTGIGKHHLELKQEVTLGRKRTFKNTDTVQPHKTSYKVVKTPIFFNTLLIDISCLLCVGIIIIILLRIEKRVTLTVQSYPMLVQRCHQIQYWLSHSIGLGCLFLKGQVLAFQTAKPCFLTAKCQGRLWLPNGVESALYLHLEALPLL